jgi:hypothetical protein
MRDLQEGVQAESSETFCHEAMPEVSNSIIEPDPLGEGSVMELLPKPNPLTLGERVERLIYIWLLHEHIAILSVSNLTSLKILVTEFIESELRVAGGKT